MAKPDICDALSQHLHAGKCTSRPLPPLLDFHRAITTNDRCVSNESDQGFLLPTPAPYALRPQTLVSRCTSIPDRAMYSRQFCCFCPATTSTPIPNPISAQSRTEPVWSLFHSLLGLKPASALCVGDSPAFSCAPTSNRACLLASRSALVMLGEVKSAFCSDICGTDRLRPTGTSSARTTIRLQNRTQQGCTLVCTIP